MNVIKPIKRVIEQQGNTVQHFHMDLPAVAGLKQVLLVCFASPKRHQHMSSSRFPTFTGEGGGVPIE
jgi:hypothetical protein